ncbi:nuclear factor NF-kappa-B p100 subunit [Xenopus laevis]|uniref:Nuclear factor NF-kappa-B p100 subunit n=1 Tax=Xenopus laevis TaxID=8355 RepID=NFKB2_XENLA|nr:nuclear factor NF-kappa-B p100 subunit [Xenopus laevis]O73630.1 RecName: Full=Nuclear factor NF-kappa-B p100 subunit; AltName: Full=DNA-binding factor KBF2; AltName: Full=Nuclear factor of kappa light polypeptide gene enhancer in B-cells 2; Contains: RecName: Full=Nuclear factor NF-kappa-B p52 subunit [Xenopus laevis]BAA25919.1 p100-NFkappaB2 [Xenopus laevis]
MMSVLKIENFDPYSCNGIEDRNGMGYSTALLNPIVLGQDLLMSYLSIIEQPKQRGFRFRYVCEGPSHRGLPGASSEKGKKTFPTVKIFNYVGMARIEVDLVTHTDPPRVHAHSLVGKHSNKTGNCIVTVGPEDMTAQFNNLGIVHVTKKSQTEILKEKMKRNILRNTGRNTLTEVEERKIEQEVKDLKKVTDLSIVRLKFTAYLPDSNGAYTLALPPVISDPIHDSKSPGASNLRISRMDKTAGSVKGGDEVYLLCDKVQKDDIEVQFYEDDENGWHAFGDFAPTDVHKQYAIVFRTPPYHTQKIDRPVTVFLQLKRKKGGDVSDSKQFTYYPLEQDKEEVERKRRKDLPTFNNHFYGGGSPMGGAPPGSSFGQGGGSNINYQYTGMNSAFYMSSPAGGGYHSSGHMMKHCSATNSSEKNQQPSISIKKEGEEASACSQTDSATTAQKEAQCQMIMRQANLRMLSLTQRTSRALLDYATTADPRMLLAVQRHLTATQDENGDTPLHLAVIHGQSSVIEQLVQIILSIPNQQILNMSNHLQQTPLHLGVITKQYSVVAFLLKAGADPTILDRYGNSVLHLAVQSEDDKMLGVLLKYPSVGQKNLINMPDYHGLSPVHWSVKMKNEKCLVLLVKAGANVNSAERKSGKSPLHIAVEMDNLNLAVFLVKKLHADINAKTYGGNTPLHLAASRGSPMLTRMLVNEGANVLSENDEPVNKLPSCNSDTSESDSDVQMDTDSDHHGDSDTDSSTAVDSECEHSAEEMHRREQRNIRPHCAMKRRYSGHTAVDLTKSQKVRDILSKHTPGSASWKQKGPEPVNVLALETNTVQRLEKLLNEGQTGADWTELASRLRLQSLVETYKNTSSPTESLLRNYELAGGNLKELINTLQSMGLNEGVELLCKSETYAKHHSPAESKNDSAYESQSMEVDQSSGNLMDDSQKQTIPVSAAELCPTTEPTIGQ